jgi:hypothetical protein
MSSRRPWKGSSHTVLPPNRSGLPVAIIAPVTARDVTSAPLT